jgi:uncharacterized Zn finger protein (UPF0148 family)
MITKVKANLPSPKKETEIEYLKEGQECPNCHFAKLKKEGNEIFCPICSYGKKGCT